jgi:hypothetical protein
MSYRQALMLVGVMENRKNGKWKITTRGQQGALSGSERIHGQRGHQEVVFDVALVSAVVCVQV